RTKAGRVLVALLATPLEITVNCGFTAGLLPPTAGCAWQAAQLFSLKRGPSPPSAIVSISLKVARPSLKNARLPAGLFAATEARGPPAPAAPLRTLGSLWANAVPTMNSAATARGNFKTENFRLVMCECLLDFQIVQKMGLFFRNRTADY